MPIPIYYGSSYKRIPATFDFTDEHDSFSTQEKQHIAEELNYPIEEKLNVLVGKDKQIYKILNSRYERGNIYRFFDLYYFSTFPLYYVESYRKDGDKYYKRSITWFGWILNQLFTFIGILVTIGLVFLVQSNIRIFLWVAGCIFAILIIGLIVKFVGNLPSNDEKIVKDWIDNCKKGNRFVNLDHLKSVTPGQLKILSNKFCGTISLNGLTEITDELAEAISEFDYPHLGGLTEITDTQAEILAKSHYGLHLDGLKSITNKQAKIFSKIHKDLSLNGLKKISDSQLKILSKRTHETCLDGLEKITDEQADIIFKINNFSLEGLREITDYQAKLFSEIDKTIHPSISFPKIKKLNDKQRKILEKNWNLEFEDGLILY